MSDEKNMCSCDHFSEYKDYFEGSEELKKEYKLACLEFKEKLLEGKLDFVRRIRQILGKTENVLATIEEKPAEKSEEIKKPEKIEIPEKNGKNEKSPEKQ